MYDNVRKPESDWYEAGYTAPRTDAAGTGCYDSYWSPSQAAAPKKKSHQGLKITMIILGVLVLIIASCYVFAGRGREAISSDGEPGQHGSVTLPARTRTMTPPSPARMSCRPRRPIRV